MSTRTVLTACVTLTLAATFAACDSGDGDVVARAGDYTFTVDEAASLLQQRDARLPNSEDLVGALAELWVDYTLLGDAVATDPTLNELNVDELVQDQLDQETLLQFRDIVLDPDTAFSDEELRREFEQEGSLTQLRARHILLSYPEETTEAQRDSVRALAEELRSRAMEGEDFSELAREYSDDTGSAEEGGDLGTFGRGRMVPAFEEAAFALEPGEISEPVQSPYGLHLIVVDERIPAEFEEHREQFAQQLRERRMAVAESTYVVGVEERAEVDIPDESYEEARQIAARSSETLDDADRALVRFEGGELTAEDFQSFVRARSGGDRQQIQEAGDEQIENILRSLTRRELLLAAARDSGAAPEEGRGAELRSEIVEQVRTAAEQIGLSRIEPQENESEADAVERSVLELLEQIVTGQQNVAPMGPLGPALRNEYGADFNPEAYPRVVERVQTAEGDAGAEDGVPAPAPGGAGSDGPPPAPEGEPGSGDPSPTP